MQKELFSKKISESMYKKINAIELEDSNTFLEKDENFEIALCLSYMTLSKEKIIHKDMKNTNRMDRLSKMVDTSEIDKVFKPDFSKEMPRILEAKEQNNLWILDNIRDSIMHGSFDIDEENKCFLINNTQYDRELKAEIPFSWFIAYAKNDILSKKTLDSYTIRNIYYNKDKDDKHFFDTKKELMNNILYRVDIQGNNFNIRNIENRIKELFNIYSKEEIDTNLIEKYINNIDSEKIKYNQKYLVSFYIAKEKVKKIIEKEFPKVTIDITVDNKKHKFVNQTIKRLPPYYANYDLMIEAFNQEASSKGMTLLKYISNIIENIDSEKLENLKETEDEKVNNTNKFNIILNNEELKNTDNKHVYMIADNNKKILKSICLNVYGLSTLVINHENLYNDKFFNAHPYMYGIKACQKNSYLEYATKRKTIILKILETEIALFSKKEQLKFCNNDNIKSKIQSFVDSLQAKKELLEEELTNLQLTLNFERVEKTNNLNIYEKNKLENIIKTYTKHFYESKTVETKRKILKIISRLLTAQIEEESKYTYGYCNNMKEVLLIIRNCFSHIGRIYIGKDRGENTYIVLNDYDNDGQKSGEVICRYQDLIELLREPYIPEQTNKRTLKNGE